MENQKKLTAKGLIDLVNNQKGEFIIQVDLSDFFTAAQVKELEGNEK